MQRDRLLARAGKNPLLAMVSNQKLQTIVRKPNGDLDFPGQIPRSHTSHVFRWALLLTPSFKHGPESDRPPCYRCSCFSELREASA